jgi:hypothetical protein
MEGKEDYLEKGFEPVVTVLDKEGKPVQDVWVDISKQREGYGIAYWSRLILAPL